MTDDVVCTVEHLADACFELARGDIAARGPMTNTSELASTVFLRSGPVLLSESLTTAEKTVELLGHGGVIEAGNVESR